MSGYGLRYAHGGANYSVAMARTLAIVVPGPFGRNSAFRPIHFPLGVSRLPGRDLRGCARPAVVDRVSSRRRHPDYGTSRPPAHRAQRQAAAERRRGPAARRPQQPGRAARGRAASQLRRRTGCCTSPIQRRLASRRLRKIRCRRRPRSSAGGSRTIGSPTCSSSSSRCRRAAGTSAARSPSTRTASCSSRSAIARCRPKATSRRIRRRICPTITAR